MSAKLGTLCRRVMEAEGDLVAAYEDADDDGFDALMDARVHYLWVSILQHAEEIKTGMCWWSDGLDARAYLVALKVIVAHLEAVTEEAA
jgi:hypothetical protein